MRVWLASILLAPLVLVGPARASFGPGDTIGVALTFGALVRTYNVHVPASYDGSTPVPLVLDFHGYTANAASQQGLSGLAALSETAGFIVAFPEGYVNSWNAGGTCCGAALASGLDDVGLARAIVADIQAQANIDSRRIYSTGLSNGGAMTHRLGCEAADLFAAFVSVAAPLALDPVSLCAPVRPVPILHFAGLTDGVVPYEGGESPVLPGIFLPSAAVSFAQWVGVDGCTGPSTIEPLHLDATCETYTTCTDDVVAALCSIHGTVFYNHVLYFNDDGMNVAQRTWDFLSAFLLPEGFLTTTTTTSTSTTSTSTTTTLLPIASCAPAPSAGCVAAGKAAIAVNEKRAGREKVKLALTALTMVLQPSDFGDPVTGTTSVAVCVYDGSNGLVASLPVDRAGETCGTRPCWKTITAGFKYADPAAGAAGVRAALAKAGETGKGKVTVAARNKAPDATAMPTGVAAALATATSATVRVVTSDAACFGATLPTVTRADGLTFKAKAP